MKLIRYASALAVAAIFAGTSANAYTLAQAGKPKENPPAGYTGQTFVDSRGCIYSRIEIGNIVNWAPLMSADRKSVVCNGTPTSQTGTRTASTTGSVPLPPAPPAPSEVMSAPVATAETPFYAAPSATATTTVQTASAGVVAPAPTGTRVVTGGFGTGGTSYATSPVAPVSAAAAAPVTTTAVTRTLSVTCPADGSSARVRIGGSTVSVACDPSATSPIRYIVKHPNGERTRLIANPAPGARAASATTLVSNDARVRIGGVPPGGATNNFGNGYGVMAPAGVTSLQGATGLSRPVTTAQQARFTYGGIYAGDVTTLVGAESLSIPAGYRVAWDDDRLNPNRGPRSATGDMQMATVYDITSVPMQELAPSQPSGLIYAPETDGVVVSTKNAIRPAPATATTAVTRTVKPTQVAAAAPATATLSRRYVQVGMFNVPSNAERAAAKLQSLGLPGRVAKTASGKTVVIAGPYDSAAALKNALAVARRGFPDAFLRN